MTKEEKEQLARRLAQTFLRGALSEAFDKARHEGYARGWRDGYDKGYAEGDADGYDKGVDNYY